MDLNTIKAHPNKLFSLLLNLSLIFLISFYIISISSDQSNYKPALQENWVSETDQNCAGVRKMEGYRSKCGYVRSNSACLGKGYLNYLEIFYCTCSNNPTFGYFVLLLWLVILFYVLANTTSEYFIPSVESLSRVLKLSPTIAGTTLLPLGNGANDVFASIISFTRSGDNGDVGLNSVLGGAFFISCFVVGIVSIAISSRGIRVDKRSFVRDVLFFLFVLCCLLVIIVVGKVSLWFALCFFSMYFLYIGVVCVMHFFRGEDEKGIMGVPLLRDVDEEKGDISEKDDLKANLFHRNEEKGIMGIPLLCNVDQKNIDKSSFYYCWSLLLYVLELPLSLPRRVTIPIVSEEKWSKPFATISSTLAPILLAALLNKHVDNDVRTHLAVYVSSIFIGIILGTLSFVFIKKTGPPKGFLFPWLAGGFLMSITWTYIIVEELVSLLVAFGNILGISPSILGLTVLAWGNSVGDLVSNLGMALKGGPNGTQVAVSGCYAGPVFNTLVGLGLSLVFASWEEYPNVYVIHGNTHDLYEIVGFLMGGLLWALVILPKRNMEMDKSLGIGLLSIYFCFLFLRFVKGVGILKLGGSFCLTLKDVDIFPRF